MTIGKVLFGKILSRTTIVIVIAHRIYPPAFAGENGQESDSLEREGSADVRVLSKPC